jgi:hypothetical protein
MSRWKASFIHLLISIAVVGSLAAFILYFWYPPALLHMAKADQLLMLIAGIDLVVGPLLTLIIYKHGKRGLKLDLAIIGLMQLCFLSYGVYATWNSRPVFLVAVPDRFELVYANEITSKNLAEAHDAKFGKLGNTKPVLVGAEMPTNVEEQQKIMMSSLGGAGDIQNMPKYFVDYSQVAKKLLTKSKLLEEGKGLSPKDAQSLQLAAESYGYKKEDLRYLPLASSRGFAVILVNAKTGDVIGAANVDP